VTVETDENRAARQLAAFFERHATVLMLTGAGMSTASGIPDYRDRDGVRRGNAPVQGPDFRRHEAVRKRYWARSMVGYPSLARAEPNPGHRAIAALQAQGRLAGLVTQNVDGLHQRAGSADVVELHGSIHAVVCLDCGARFPRPLVQRLLEQANPGRANPGRANPGRANPGPGGASLAAAEARPLPDGDAQLEPAHLADFHLPLCVHCAGTLKPDVVFFGDGVERERAEAAQQQLARADALLVVGSSVMVYSSFRLCRQAAEAGKPVAALNFGMTRADHLLSWKAEAAAEQVLPLLAGLLENRLPR